MWSPVVTWVVLVLNHGYTEVDGSLYLADLFVVDFIPGNLRSPEEDTIKLTLYRTRN